MPAKQVYRYALTFFQFPTPKAMDKNLIYFICGEEISPSTKKKHWQAYVEFYRLRTRALVKGFFNDKTVHIERCRRGTRANIRYCSKDGRIVHCLGNPASLGWTPISAGCKPQLKKPQCQKEAEKESSKVVERLTSDVEVPPSCGTAPSAVTLSPTSKLSN